MGEDTPVIGRKALGQDLQGLGLNHLGGYSEGPSINDLVQSGQQNKSLPPPSQGIATGYAIDDADNRQQNLRNASTVLTGGQGLLDEPMTASRVLLGN